MVSNIDEGKGLVKTYWSDIRQRISKIDPRFASIVDELSPDKAYPLYLAYYPYGAIKGDTLSTFLPSSKGEYYRVSDTSAPKDVVKHLGYSINSAPFAMLLDKNLELFVDLPDQGITIPRVIYKPGSFFPFTRILSRNSTRTYAPNGVLTMTSGCRSIFMLPNIGCATNHANLQRDFDVQSSPAKSLYEQWYVFKEITNSKVVNCDWNACLLYFSQSWLDKLSSDKSWMTLKLYFHELSWKYYEYERSHFYYDFSFSMIQKKRNLKPNPYLADTARHLISTALGSAPGYVPSCDNDALPNDVLQKVFIESYGLKKYVPTILQPSHFNFETDKFPIYYSLQHPSTHMFSPKSRKVASTLSEMRELERIARIFIQELAKEENMCAGTVVSKIAKNVEFSFYHNKIDMHRTIRPAAEMIKFDKRFNSDKSKKNEAKFASDAPFVRGCISIKNKN